MRPIVWTRGLWVAAAIAGPLGLSLATVTTAGAAPPAVDITATGAADNPFAGLDTFAPDGDDPFRSADEPAGEARDAAAPQLVVEAPIDITAGDVAASTKSSGAAAAPVRTAGFEQSDAGAGVQPVGWWDDADNTAVTAASDTAAPALNNPIGTQSTTPIVSTTVGEASAAAVQLKWTSLTPVNIGQECRCSLEVTNTGGQGASGVTVEAHFPKTVRLTAVAPQPTAVQSFLGWDLGEMPAGSSRTLQVSYIPSAGGSIEPHATVRYSASSRTSFAVLRPELSGELVAGPSVKVGEPAPQTVRLHNPGTGIARNVQVEVTVPDGLAHPAGRRLITDVGLLHPGETRTIRVALAAVAGGQHTVQMRATADGNLLAESASTVAVVTPQLAARIDGPTLRYLGRTADFDLTVTNDGASADDNVRLMHKLPAGWTFVGASRGSRFDAASGIVSWFVGRVEAGESKSVRVTLKATAPGSQTHFVRASGEHGVQADSTFATRIEAVSLVGVEVQDLEDPVEVGREVGYEIRVSNEGSAPARDVRLVCELPDGARVSRADGPVGYDATGQAVQFASLATIEPGQTRTFRVIVTGTQPGNGYFKASVQSDGAEPITADELTRFYGER